MRCEFFQSCGNCDFLDLDEDDYQKLKSNLLKKTLSEISIEPRFIWLHPQSRRRVILQINNENQFGFFAKKSKKIVAIDECFIATKAISGIVFYLQNFLKSQEKNFFVSASITEFDNVIDIVFTLKRAPNLSQLKQLTLLKNNKNINLSYKLITLIKDVIPVFINEKNKILYNNFKLELDSEVFIQATKSGLGEIFKIIYDFVKNNFTQKKPIIADIYAGFGAYTFLLRELSKKIFSFEGSEKMVDSINKNAIKNGFNNIESSIRDLFHHPLNKKELEKIDLVIINPPRNGATPQILEISKSQIKNLIYISCNSETFTRDSRALIDAGFDIASLTAIDQFYSTKHFELVAIFKKN
jgi:23S rRNA (uracil1939-C5)-methyltransferase